MSLLGLGAATVASIGSNLLGGIMGAHNTAKAAEQSFNYQKQLAEYINTNKHQWEVQDLRAAGLNPILSATNGSALNGGAVNVTPAGDYGLGSSAEKLMQAKELSIADKNANIAQQNADTQSAAQKSQATVNSANEKYLHAQELFARANADYKEKEIRDLMPILVLNAAKQGQVYDTQSAANLASANASNAIAGYNSAQTLLSGANLEAANLANKRTKSLGYGDNGHMDKSARVGEFISNLLPFGKLFK